jgi:hypothetical protein
MTEEIQPDIKVNIFNKKQATKIVATLATIWILTAGLFYYLGSQSKNDQIKACHKTLGNVSDLLNEYDLDPGYKADLEKCDPSFK